MGRKHGKAHVHGNPGDRAGGAGGGPSSGQHRDGVHDGEPAGSPTDGAVERQLPDAADGPGPGAPGAPAGPFPTGPELPEGVMSEMPKFRVRREIVSTHDEPDPIDRG